MARRRKRSEKKFYRYECGITGEQFKVTREAPNPEELLSIDAYYQMNPEEDDRPEVVKKRLSFQEEASVEGAEE